MTTNRSFEEWGNIFGDVVLASAMVDRIVHYSHIIRISGNSYRMKDLIKKDQ
ncbi:MAG: ATP-binding protein [bacterium]